MNKRLDLGASVHALLFDKELFMYVLNLWGQPTDKVLSDPKIKEAGLHADAVLLMLQVQKAMETHYSV